MSEITKSQQQQKCWCHKRQQLVTNSFSYRPYAATVDQVFNIINEFTFLQLAVYIRSTVTLN